MKNVAAAKYYEEANRYGLDESGRVVKKRRRSTSGDDENEKDSKAYEKARVALR